MEKKPHLSVVIQNIKKFGCDFIPYFSSGFYNHSFCDHKRTYFIALTWIYWYIAIELEVPHYK